MELDRATTRVRGNGFVGKNISGHESDISEPRRLCDSARSRYGRRMTPPGLQERIWTAALLVIGDEILSGRTQDKNVAQVALWLNMQGIRLTEVRVVADDMELIGRAVVELKAGNDYLFTTGGIGPTHDDITVDAIARALDVEVVIHPKARKALEDYYTTRGGLTDARLRMARVPDGAELIENRMSGAPGIRMGNIFILAGVPHIAGLMLEALSNQLEGGRPMLSRTIGCWVAESEVADLLREVEAANAGSQIGSYPFFQTGKVGANFVVRSIDAGTVDSCIAAIGSGLILLGYEPVADGILLPAS